MCHKAYILNYSSANSTERKQFMFNFSKYAWLRACKRVILRQLIYIWKSISKIATISLQEYHVDDADTKISLEVNKSG